MTKPALVILNTKSRGGGASQRETDIAAAFKQHNYPVEIRPAGPDITQTTREALNEGYTTIIAAGGDGTIRAVASVIAQYGGTLGIIPVGTFNHFAKDIAVPTDISSAVQVIVAGHHRQVDCSSVNGRFFLNSAALGLHALFVRRRQVYEGRIGKWLAIPVALSQTFVRFKPWPLSLTVNGQTQACEASLVFIGNNDYQVERLGLPSRNDLHGGRLYIYLLTAKTRWQLVRLTLRVLFGRSHNEQFFAVYNSDQCLVDTKATVHVTLDGELTQLKPPLDFRSHPGKLTVLVPEKQN